MRMIKRLKITELLQKKSVIMTTKVSNSDRNSRIFTKEGFQIDKDFKTVIVYLNDQKDIGGFGIILKKHRSGRIFKKGKSQ